MICNEKHVYPVLLHTLRHVCRKNGTRYRPKHLSVWYPQCQNGNFTKWALLMQVERTQANITESDTGWQRGKQTHTDRQTQARREKINGNPPTSQNKDPLHYLWDYNLEWCLIKASTADAEIYAAVTPDPSIASALCDRCHVWLMGWLWDSTVISLIKVTAQNEITITPVGMGVEGLFDIDKMDVFSYICQRKWDRHPILKSLLVCYFD